MVTLKCMFLLPVKIVKAWTNSQKGREIIMWDSFSMTQRCYNSYPQVSLLGLSCNHSGKMQSYHAINGITWVSYMYMGAYNHRTFQISSFEPYQKKFCYTEADVINAGANQSSDLIIVKHYKKSGITWNRFYIGWVPQIGDQQTCKIP